ncbi:protein of unknown function [Marinitoga hydrogenitolerans DSM 16785]|uniref:Uncharacterized protein n=1 Tax=Marinitoga hydrogenitolerans (strain DSM 16785 / JCM 12826 / AT1271) TaxID=1122195 RepID=A0A1M4TZ83_MARH1|nr:DUF4895 domain-containing protein [Marinitoga hydrogenitolerans]SHE49656.1 protein of unknown function [Marinitoga hydrogenitolerans DSM 16785]
MIYENSFKELKKISIEYFNEKKDKLDDAYEHLIAFSIFDINNRFPSLNLFFDNNGRSFLSLMPGKPSMYMSALYPTKIDNKEIDILKERYYRLSKKYNKNVNININMSIYQSPLIIPSFFIEGNENIIKKYILSEKLKGVKYISLSKYIDTVLLDFILNSYNTWYFQGVYLYYTLNEVHFVFDIPNDFNNKTLAIELGKLTKLYVIRNNPLLSESYKIPDMNIKKPVLMVLKTNVWNLKEFDLEYIRKDIIDKINNSYQCVLNVFK